MSVVLDMTFDTTGPGGVPGALRSAAAVYPVVTITARVALKVARDLDGLAAARVALQETNDAADRVQDACAKVLRQMRLVSALSFGLGAVVGGVLAVLA